MFSGSSINRPGLHVNELTHKFSQVLFQNDSPATLLARVIGIIGPIEQAMLAKGRDTYKYFSKNHMLYERNQVQVPFLYLSGTLSSITCD